MNTVRILICATFALLIAALVHSYSTRGDKSVSDLKDELAQLRLKNSSQQNTNLTPYNQYGPTYFDSTPATSNNTFVNPLAPANDNTTTEPSPSDEALARIDALEIENAKLKEQQSQQETENSMLQEEAGAIQHELEELNKPDDARAAEIAQALIMAKVKIYAADKEIIVLDLVRPQNLTSGQVLGIRRGTSGGIIGRIKLGHIENNALGYADPIAKSFFGGPVDIQVGDEIIVIP